MTSYRGPTAMEPAPSKSPSMETPSLKSSAATESSSVEHAAPAEPAHAAGHAAAGMKRSSHRTWSVIHTLGVVLPGRVMRACSPRCRV